MARCTFYVQIEPEWNQYSHAKNGDLILHSIKAKRITQSRPDSPLSSTITVKLTVEVPDSAFQPLRPEAVIVIPESFVQENPVEVVAEDASNPPVLVEE